MTRALIGLLSLATMTACSESSDTIVVDALCDRATSVGEVVRVELPADRITPDPVIVGSSAVACLADAGIADQCCNATTHRMVLGCAGDDITFEQSDGRLVVCEARTEGSGGSPDVEASAECLARETTSCALGGATVTGSFNAAGRFVLE